jgi:hypothetical protein
MSNQAEREQQAGLSHQLKTNVHALALPTTDAAHLKNSSTRRSNEIGKYRA